MNTRSLHSLVCLLTAMAGMAAVRADTYVCGNVVNETWTRANSPYRVTCDAVVSRLTIEPGVCVLFETNCVLRVAGKLTAVGAAQDPIVFTQTNGSGGWQGIFFNQNPPGSELAHCVINGSTNSGIRIYRATPAIRNCVVANNSSPAVGGGITITNDLMTAGDVLLRDCVISNNTSFTSGGGIFATMGTNTLVLDGCVVSANQINPAKASQNSASGGGVRISGNSRFLRCQIMDNYCYARGGPPNGNPASTGGGIQTQQGTAVMDGTTIAGNLAWAHYGYNVYADLGAGGGISITSGELYLANCAIAGNNAYSRYSTRGSGLYVNGASTWVNLWNCIVAGNGTSFAGARGSGVWVHAGTVGVTNCTIASNIEYGAIRYGGTLAIHNSIVYFNGLTPEISGTATVNYSCVGGGHAGVGNFSLEPFFTAPTDFVLLPYSPCIDAGDPSPAFNDTCLPPSQGSVTNDLGAYGGPLACSWPMAPQIVSQPFHQNACPGSSVTFCVRAWGEEPLSYQWLHLGNVVDGATNACLSLSVKDFNQAGAYAVVVANQRGSVTSEAALLKVSPACLSLALYPGLTIMGEVGRTYALEWTGGLEEPVHWYALTNLTLNAPEVLWIDPRPASQGERFYRIKP